MQSVTKPPKFRLDYLKHSLIILFRGYLYEVGINICLFACKTNLKIELNLHTFNVFVYGHEPNRTNESIRNGSLNYMIQLYLITQVKNKALKADVNLRITIKLQ